MSDRPESAEVRTFNRQAAVPIVQANQEIRGENDPWGFKNVLALDGGGIRGYYSLRCLGVLVDYIKQAEQGFIDGNGVQNAAPSSFHPIREPVGVSHQAPHGQNYLLYHYFDYICGTSTGGLIAIMLSRLRMSVDDCTHEYLELGGKIFGSPRLFHSLNFPPINRTKYATEPLEDAIQHVIDKHEDQRWESYFASHNGSCQTFVCAYKHNPRQNHIAMNPWIFRSYDQVRGEGNEQLYPRNPGRASLNTILEVARATTAAPLIFESLKTYALKSRRSKLMSGPSTRPPDAEYTDGGFGPANNPSSEIYHELLRSSESIGTFVSVGTGRKSADRFRKGLSSVLRGAVDAVGDTEVTHAAMAELVDLDYFRFNEPESLSDIDFDEWKGPKGSKTIEKMDRVFAAWAIKASTQAQFKACADQLVRRRRLRAEDHSKWECYSLGSSFHCSLPQCPEDKAVKWMGRDAFEQHLLNVHAGNQDVINDHSREVLINRCQTLWRYPPQANGTNGVVRGR